MSLEAASKDIEIDWVVGQEFSAILRGHPRISKLWEFDRSTGIKGWLRLCDELLETRYDEVWDLHSTLRTRIAAFYFAIRRWKRPIWRRFRKERWRLVGLFIFKKGWPHKFLPHPFVERFAKFSGGSGLERPNLRHLVHESENTLKAVALDKSGSGFPGAQTYYCVMPGSKWKGKCWPSEKFLEVICRSEGTPVILGGPKDEEANELIRLLEAKGITYFSGVGKWNLRQVASVLASSRAYLGNDTGLAHLAEALGVPALMIFGPTAPEMGFGPWRSESVGMGMDLECRPCSKDGKRCYRMKEKYLCMTGLDAKSVAERFERMQRPPK